MMNNKIDVKQLAQNVFEEIKPDFQNNLDKMIKNVHQSSGYTEKMSAMIAD